jgi:long-chain acyl-CoA synthetase
MRKLSCIADVVRRTADACPDRVALQDAAGVRRVTYGELWRRVAQGTATLRRSGLETGDRVLLLRAPGPDWIPAFLSIVNAGLVAAPLPHDVPDELVRLGAAFTGARAWIADDATEARASALRHLTRVAPDDPGSGPGASAEATVDPASPAALVFTSGSVSRPRAVVLSHRNLCANLRALLAARQAAPDEALLSTLPPSHAYELVAGQLAPLAAGARIVYAGVPLPNRVVETIRTQSITRVALVPALFEALAREVICRLVERGAADRECRDSPVRDLANRVRRLPPGAHDEIRRAVRACVGPSLRTLVVGGAALDAAWVDVLTRVGIDLDVGYGLTEAGPVVAMGRAGECPADSCGRPLPGVDVRVAPDGEVLVQSDAIMQGYAGDPAATTAAFVDGWLRTGDCGRLDAEGFLFITGRLKEAMVTAAGETIYPDEIEPYFSSPLFAEWAVVPAAGEAGNDRPILVVVPADPLASTHAIERAAAVLNAAAPARLRISGVIVRRAPLPRTTVGKIRRRAIAAEIDAAGVTT